MNKTFKKVALGIVACVLLLVVGYQFLLVVNEYMVRGRVKQLLLATSLYHAEHKEYPKTLHDMVNANFLSETDIRALTGGLRFQYEPPTADDILNDRPIMTAKLGSLIVLGHPSGNIESTRK